MPLRSGTARVTSESDVKLNGGEWLRWLAGNSPAALRLWAAGVTALAVLIVIVTHLPGVPYNVRELLRPGAEALSALLLALALGTMAAFPRWALLAVLGHGASRALRSWPLLLLGVAVASALLIWAAVPDEAVHDVVGGPVLAWWGPVEPVLRLTTLLAGLLWLALGGGVTLWPRLARGPDRGGLLMAWVICSLAILPLVHAVVVEAAATDNLTELMADGGGARASLALGAYIALLGAGGAAVARPAQTGSGRSLLLVGVAASIPLGWALLRLGTESMLVKYGRAFSALQFLLSTDRAHYAAGVELFLRFAVVHSLAILVCAWSHRLATFDLPGIAGSQSKRPRIS